jgi:predicted dehydrogenase
MIHRVGLIGCGWVAPFHVNALRNLRSRAQVVWVADPVVDRTEHIAKRVIESGLTANGDVKRLADYSQGLGDVDSVFILLPHHLHHRAAIDCLDAGCQVLIEKPLAVSLAEADDMIATADRKGRLLMVAYPHRYRKTTQAFKKLIESGDYGQLFLLDAMMDENQRGYTDLGWIQSKRTLGGGVFFSASPHMLDVMLWIGGELKTIAMVGTHAGIPMEGEDTAVSIMKFASGVIGTTRHSWASPSPRIWYTMRAFCEEAILTLTANPVGDLVREGSQCRWESRIEVSPPGEVLLDSDEGLDFTGELTHFFDCLDTGQPCQTDARVGRYLMAAVFSAYDRAAQDGGN